MKENNLLRWLAIAGLGGCGVYPLVDGILHGFAKPDADWVVLWFFIIPFAIVYCGLFITPAYFIFRRQYRQLRTFISALAAVIVCGVLLSLPVWLGVYEYFSDWGKVSRWVNIIALPVGFAALLIPFYAAGWVYRRLQEFCSRRFQEDSELKQAA